VEELTEEMKRLREEHASKITYLNEMHREEVFEK